MKAIIIEEDRFVDFVEQLRARKLSLSHETTNFLREPEGISQSHWEGLIQDIHHDFHCLFVRWAQKEGASCVR
jgi:hypothetical protein